MRTGQKDAFMHGYKKFYLHFSMIPKENTVCVPSVRTSSPCLTILGQLMTLTFDYNDLKI